MSAINHGNEGPRGSRSNKLDRLAGWRRILGDDDYWQLLQLEGPQQLDD